jgi:hypothetical protein
MELNMLSNTERGKAFQLLCRDALKRALSRDFDLEVPLQIGGGKSHSFDLAIRERDVVVECKVFKFTAGGNNPSAKITTLREAAMYVRSIPGNVERILIVKHDPHPKREETLGRYFVRPNASFLEQVTVLEMPESGGELVRIHGSFGAAKAIDA